MVQISFFFFSPPPLTFLVFSPLASERFQVFVCSSFLSFLLFFSDPFLGLLIVRRSRGISFLKTRDRVIEVRHVFRPSF